MPRITQPRITRATDHTDNTDWDILFSVVCVAPGLSAGLYVVLSVLSVAYVFHGSGCPWLGLEYCPCRLVSVAYGLQKHPGQHGRKFEGAAQATGDRRTPRTNGVANGVRVRLPGGDRGRTVQADGGRANPNCRRAVCRDAAPNFAPRGALKSMPRVR